MVDLFLFYLYCTYNNYIIIIIERHEMILLYLQINKLCKSLSVFSSFFFPFFFLGGGGLHV